MFSRPKRFVPSGFRGFAQNANDGLQTPSRLSGKQKASRNGATTQRKRESVKGMEIENAIIRLEQVPDALIEISATDLHGLFPQPALIHLGGDQPEPLFVSVLLHGNESSGLAVVQTLLKTYASKPWPRAVSFLFGNVQAAREGLRRLDGQPDFNRIWPGTELGASPETRWAQKVYADMAARGVFASIDIHNNTGRNPHYSCVERLDGQSLNLGVLFDRLVIYSPYPKGTQTGAFKQVCPSVTLECGSPGEASGVEHAVEFIEKCLRLPEIPCQPPAAEDIDLFHALAQVLVRDEVSFSYDYPAADLLLRPQLDELNFTELTPGTLLGKTKPGSPPTPLPLIARTDDGRDVAGDYFRIENNQLVLTQGSMLCMLSMDERIIRQDCLCYLMERITEFSTSNNHLIASG